jgi:hypothetical protein
MHCSQCHQDLGNLDKRVAFICGEVMGDEYIYSYWYCEKCEVFTLETYHDRFLGEAIITVSEPISRHEGEQLLKLISNCPEPANKRCHCDTHKKLF